MINLNGCPRCNGAVLDYGSPPAESPMCVNCGWRKTEIPADVLEQYEAHLGKAYMEERYVHTRIGTGKPPLNGWQRVKRRREREAALATEQERADSRTA